MPGQYTMTPACNSAPKRQGHPVAADASFNQRVASGHFEPGPQRASRPPTRPSVRSESGVAVLGVTVVLLLVLSLMGLYANRAVWLEQKTTSNQYRAKQAMEAAEAGLEYMLGVLNVKTSGTAADELYDFLSKDSTTGNYNLVSGVSPLVRSPGTGQVFSVEITRISGGAAENTPPTRRFLISSTGGSDCSSTTSLSSCQSRAVARLKVRLTGPMANPPDSGLVVRNQTTLSGSSCVVNNSNSGKAVRTGQSAINVTGGGGGGSSAKGCTGSNTTILNNNQNSGSCSGTNPNTSCTDPIIGGLSGDAFFNLFFSATKAEMKAGASITLTDTRPTAPANGELIWIDVTGNSPIMNGGTYGSVADPTILILNGDSKITGNVTFYGIIYVIGNLNLQGTLDIEGAVIVEGDADVSGNAQVAKNQGVLNSVAGGLPPVMKLMGSWKDW